MPSQSKSPPVKTHPIGTVGADVAFAVGSTEGTNVGGFVGEAVGKQDGDTVGTPVGEEVVAVGPEVGIAVGTVVGSDGQSRIPPSSVHPMPPCTSLEPCASNLSHKAK